MKAIDPDRDAIHGAFLRFGYHDRLSGSVIWFGYIARLYRSFTQMPPSLHTIQRRWPGQHSALINRPAPASVIAKLTPDHADSSLTIDAYIEPSIEPALSGTSILFYLGRRLISAKWNSACDLTFGCSTYPRRVRYPLHYGN